MHLVYVVRDAAKHEIA